MSTFVESKINNTNLSTSASNNELTILKGLFQNRVAALGIIGIVGMIGTNDFGGLVPVGLLTLGTTNFGRATAKINMRTCQHIKRFGHIDVRFFIKAIGNDWNNPVIGYCQLQGMYLAAKKYGMENEFFVLKKEHSNNMIPNF